jgi:hypothetical protein
MSEGAGEKDLILTPNMDAILRFPRSIMRGLFI